jgi:hypothetical protein
MILNRKNQKPETRNPKHETNSNHQNSNHQNKVITGMMQHAAVV